MRILIIGLPRTGTHSLYKYLSESLPQTYLCQDNPYRYVHEIEKNDDMLVKVTLDNNILIKNYESLEYKCENIIKDFEKIIFLHRSNNKHLKDSYTEFLKNIYLDKQYQECKSESEKLIDEWHRIFNKISKTETFYTYEEIFTINPTIHFLNLINSLGLEFQPDLFLKYIHPHNKGNSHINKNLI